MQEKLKVTKARSNTSTRGDFGRKAGYVRDVFLDEIPHVSVTKQLTVGMS